MFQQLTRAIDPPADDPEEHEIIWFAERLDIVSKYGFTSRQLFHGGGCVPGAFQYGQ